MEIKPLFHMRPLLMAALGMLLGTLAARWLHAPAAYALAGVLLLPGVLAALLGRRGWMILLTFTALALALMALRAMEPPLTGRHTVSGRIAETPQESDAGWTLTLDGVRVDGEARKQRLRLYVRGGTPAYGQLITAEAALAAPDSVYKSSHDYRRIFCIGYAADFSVLGEARDAYGSLLALRTRLAKRITLLFPKSGGVAAGMLLGDKSGIADETMEAYRLSGAAHLLAVSGLHVSVLASAWALLFRRRIWLRFCLTALFLAAYAALTAFAPSVLRAAIMLLCFHLAGPLRMPDDRPSALSLAFVIVLLVNPYALFYVGFQLSFLAACGLALLTPMLRDRLSFLGGSLAGTLSGSAAVWFATLPAQAAFFQTVSLTSLVSNLFILPLVPFFLIPAFLVTLLSFVSLPLANALAFLPRWALVAIDGIARLGGAVSLPLPAPPPAVPLFWLCAMLFASRLCMRSRARRALYAGACLLAAAVFWRI